MVVLESHVADFALDLVTCGKVRMRTHLLYPVTLHLSIEEGQTTHRAVIFFRVPPGKDSNASQQVSLSAVDGVGMEGMTD
jgi:uncharacterized protein YcnI